MEEVKNKYKELSYQINPLVLKNIKNLNLNINEFLLLIYFMNKEPLLNLEEIKNSLDFTDEEVLNTYSELISKGIIEVIVNKENGKMTETVSLDLFYDKIVLKTKEEKKTPKDIFYTFESELGRSLSSIEYETINNWINNNIKEDVIESALKEAIMRGAPNLRYIDKLLYEWTKKNKNAEEEYKELFDYDWLGESDE